MDGYSVKEAATVLGVPKERIWELIARGVLSGAPEGDGGMRVFLQPRPARPAPLSSEQEPRRTEEPRRGNGGNGGAHAEASEGSPFHEILTEFRSLTERYGQALLALGEARGEVAALRSRVELLEARLDLRLPGPRASSTVAWEMPGYGRPSPPEAEPEAEPEPEAESELEAASEPAVESAVLDSDVVEPVEASPFETAEFAADVGVEPPAVVPDESISLPEPEAEVPEAAAPRRRRGQRSHAAIAGFAEALARAQDPTLADLPGAREAGEALAALQAEVEAGSVAREAGSEVGFAPASVVEAMAAAPEAEEAAPPESETAEELESAISSFVEPAAAIPAEELVAEEAPQAIEPPASEPPPYQPEPEPESMLQAESEGEPMPEPQASTVPEHDVATEVGTNVEAPPPAPEPIEPAPIPTDAAPSPYSTEVVEPDWFADGDFSWLEAAQAEAAQAEAVQAEAVQAEAVQAEVAQVESEESDATPAEPVATAEPAVAPAPEDEGYRVEDVASPAAEADDHERMHADASSAAEAIQDAFEEAEPEAAPVAAYAAQPMPTAEAEPEPAEVEAVADVEAEPAEVEAVADVEAEPAEAIQEAFEAEPEPAPAAAYAAGPMLTAEAEVEPADVEATAEVEAEPAVATADVEAEPAEVEATAEVEAEPAVAIADVEAEPAEAIQEAFEEAEPEPAPAEAYAAEPLPSIEAEAEPAIEATAEAEAEPETPVEARAAVAWEPDEEAEPAASAEAIQDAFEPPAPEPEGPSSPPESVQAEGPPAVAASSESPFSPDEVAVFPVRQPEPDSSRADTATAAATRDTTRDERAPETRDQAEAAIQEPPEPQPRMPGTGGLALEAAAPPVAEPQPSAPVPPIAQEEELMWLGDEFEAAGLEIATPGWRSEPEASVHPTHDAPSHEMSDSDLAQLAQDEGWEPDEVEAIRTLLGRATPATPTPAQPTQSAEPPEAVEPPPASVEPTEAQRTLAVPVDAAPPDDVYPMDEEPAERPVFEAVEAEPEPMPPTLEDAAPPSTEAEPSEFRHEVPITEPPEPVAPLSVEETIRRSLAARAERPAGASEPEWLRRRRGPAADAYRRLRRLLPG